MSEYMVLQEIIKKGYNKEMAKKMVKANYDFAIRNYGDSLKDVIDCITSLPY